MLESALTQFTDDLLIFFTGKTKDLAIKCRSKNTHQQIVKKHTENLRKLGDFSFPNKLEPWISYLEPLQSDTHQNNSSTLMEFTGKTPENLVSVSKQWLLPLHHVAEVKERIHMFLVRSVAIKAGLVEGLRNNSLSPQLLSKETYSVELDPSLENLNDLTTLRVKCLAKTIENLYLLSPECKERDIKVFVTSKHQSFKSPHRNILCSTVLNAKTCVRESETTADDFINIRQHEMSLIAQHKYGVRVSTDSKWTEFIAHLGESAVIFELLQVKPSSPVKVNLACSSAGSSKGAAFILYNCARLETILRTYQEKVDSNYYPPLPDFKDIDFTLLTQEDEWQLVFNFILGYPHLISSSLELSEETCEFKPHYICSFLCSLVRVFSQYYRRVRILTEARTHLLPVMFARIYLLKVLMGTLKCCLQILNIKSVSQM